VRKLASHFKFDNPGPTSLEKIIREMHRNDTSLDRAERL
jgi:hypothetical protein